MTKPTGPAPTIKTLTISWWLRPLLGLRATALALRVGLALITAAACRPCASRAPLMAFSVHFTHQISERLTSEGDLCHAIANRLQDTSYHPAHFARRSASGSACHDGERQQHDGPDAGHDEWPDDGFGHDLDSSDFAAHYCLDCIDRPVHERSARSARPTGRSRN